ncbi:MAG TPA: hypothetical protein VGJ22_06655 [Anaerolineales bacterium]|jgi:hypothetical protein
MNDPVVTPSPTPMSEPPKKNNTPIIITAVVVVVLCCLCIFVGLAWTYGDQILQQMNNF